MLFKYRFWLGILLIIGCVLTISFLTYKDFGVTADEELEYKSGKALLEYYRTGKDPKEGGTGYAQIHLSPTQSPYFRTHLALYSAINTNNYYEIYHLINLIFSVLLFITFYGLLFYEYKNVKISLLGTLALFLTPRLGCDIAANPKDIPFAIWYFLSLKAIYILNKNKTSFLGKVLILGPLFGITLAHRFVGLTLFGIYFVYLFVINGKPNIRGIIKHLLEISLTLIISVAILLPFWPALRTGFPYSMVKFIQDTQNFHYWDNTMLFDGQYLTKYERPQLYLPVWFMITTPLFILIPFFAAPLVFYKRRHKLKLVALFTIAIGTNFAAYFLTKPIIYNGLRHFLYLLPPIVLVSFISFVELLNWIKEKSKGMYIFIIGAYLVGMVFVLKDISGLHPYQYVYFNELVGGIRGASGRFELDYWGASYKESTEWLRENVAGVPAVYACGLDYVVQYYSHGKIRVVHKIEDAQYIICESDSDRKEKFDFPVVGTIERMGVPISVIRQRY